MINKEALLNELSFKAIRSSGAGGQHVNKVASKVELAFNLTASEVLDVEQKTLLSEKLQSKLTKNGMLILQCGDSRSQHKNKALVINRFFELLERKLKVDKIRVPTKVPRSVIKKRLKSKQHLSDKKTNRRKPSVD
ncbi:MAG: alternative ribosome rescue aminoacyl-tRNA hydrolase ArfB [Flavobacteriaceae bacterium]